MSIVFPIVSVNQQFSCMIENRMDEIECNAVEKVKVGHKTFFCSVDTVCTNISSIDTIDNLHLINHE